MRPLPQTLADRIRRSFEGDGLVELPRFERWSRFAIALAMVWVIFAGAYQALAAGPYNVRDEQAHVGYAMSLSSGRIPSLDTPTRVPPTSPALVERLAETERADGVLTPYQKVWVANHPPGAYLPALPGVWLGRAIGSGNTVLFALRMSNVFGFALTVLVTALLAREVTRRTAAGVVAAAAVAAVPYLQNVTSWAMTDGMTLAVTTAVVWAAVRALRRGFDANSTIVLAALSVACGLTRLTAVATAAVVVAVALVVHAWRNRTFPWKPAVAIGGAVAALSGWFWVWNLQRYGDLAGGHELYERFNRESTGSVTSTLTTRRFWNQLLTTIFEHPIDWAPEWRGRYTPLTTGVLVVAAIGLFALVDRIRPNDDVDRPLSGAEHPNRALSGAEHPNRALSGAQHPNRALSGAEHPNRALSGAQRSRNVLDPSRADAIDGGAVLVLVAAWVSAAVLIANHVSSGGNPFGRYVLVWLPIVACLVGAVPLLFRRPVVAAGVAGVLVGLYVRHSFKVLARFHTTLQVRFAAAENSALRRAVGPEWSQHFAHGAANVSAIVLVVLTVVAVHRAMKPHHDGLPETSGTEAVH